MLTAQQERKELMKIRKVLFTGAPLLAYTAPLGYVGLIAPGDTFVYTVMFLSFVLGPIFAGIFFVLSTKNTKLGIRGHLRIEKRFLIYEIPNITQLLTALGLVTVFLDNIDLRLIFTALIAWLLGLYLDAKRRDFIQILKKRHETSPSDDALFALNFLAITTAVLLVYLVATALGSNTSLTP